ncbi:MAG: nucleoside-diphosphate kinase [Candidatus Methylomirabilota bacterium]|nr:MAG: nucleoside-diphosphate kinase [candidate division NC10 bacterium]
MEQTLVIVKPDAVARGLIGEVIRRFEAEGLTVCGLKMVRLAHTEAEGFYQVHRARPFFDSLTRFMASGPCVAMVLKGEGAIGRVRTLMGATDPLQAAEGTLRRNFATSIEKNVVHGSDSTTSAAFEIPYFFNQLEIRQPAECGETPAM